MAYDENQIADLTITTPTEGSSYIPELNNAIREIKRALTRQWAVVVKAANYTVDLEYCRVYVDTSAAARTMTLPASPTAGHCVEFIDYAQTFDTYNLTVARNGGKINALEEDLTVDLKGANVVLTYVDATKGWVTSA